MNRPEAIIFDLDGVLVDATEWHFEALNQALHLFGWEINRQMHNTLYNGLPTVEKLKLLSKNEGFPIKLHPIIRTLKRKYMNDTVYNLCKPNYTKQLLLTYLQKKGYKLACCSNAQKYSVINMLKRSDIEKYFEVIIGNDEGFKPKPHPQVYHEACSRLGVSPQQTVIVEDAPHGVAAAKASGAKVIEVKHFDDVNLDLFLNEHL